MTPYVLEVKINDSKVNDISEVMSYTTLWDTSACYSYKIRKEYITAFMFVQYESNLLEQFLLAGCVEYYLGFLEDTLEWF